MKVARSVSRKTEIILITIIAPSNINNNTAIFGDSTPKGTNIQNLNTRLNTAN